jgi:glutamate carboxypeptidase
VDSRIAEQAAEIGARAERELEALVGVSSPSGDIAGAEEALAVCAALLPPVAQIERVPCSTAGFSPDLIARILGTGERKLMLLGHVDTVIGHEAHAALRRDGEKLYGPGTSDMKGGVVLSLGVARALAGSSDRFAELAVLLVCDEEWRTAPFTHIDRFAGYDGCLCFEAGERGPADEEGVVVKRKAAGTMRVDAIGRAAHSGSAPDRGANALLALAHAATELAALHDPAGPDRLSVVPTVIRSGEALNVVPAAGELILDLRADRLEAFGPALAAVTDRVDGATLSARMDRLWPAMDSRSATAPLLARAAGLLGRAVAGVGRGGASDASHFAPTVPLTVDGLGPRGGGAHTPEEFVFAPSLAERAEVALALAVAALEQA